MSMFYPRRSMTLDEAEKYADQHCGWHKTVKKHIRELYSQCDCSACKWRQIHVARLVNGREVLACR